MSATFNASSLPFYAIDSLYLGINFLVKTESLRWKSTCINELIYLGVGLGHITKPDGLTTGYLVLGKFGDYSTTPNCIYQHNGHWNEGICRFPYKGDYHLPYGGLIGHTQKY